jgi:hypothetical protein
MPDDMKTKRVNVLLSQDEYDDAKARAKLDGMSLSQFFRWAGIKAVRAEK